MSLIDSANLQDLTQIYLFASTPSYLYRHFRKQSSLADLARSQPIENLVAEYQNRTTQENRSVEDVVMAYAVLVSITHLPYQEAQAILDRLDLSLLDWGEDIRTIFAATTKTANVIKVRLPYENRLPDTLKSSSPNNIYHSKFEQAGRKTA
jgi:hypothetical protein